MRPARAWLSVSRCGMFSMDGFVRSVRSLGLVGVGVLSVLSGLVFVWRYVQPETLPHLSTLMLGALLGAFVLPLICWLLWTHDRGFEGSGQAPTRPVPPSLRPPTHGLPGTKGPIDASAAPRARSTDAPAARPRAEAPATGPARSAASTPAATGTTRSNGQSAARPRADVPARPGADRGPAEPQPGRLSRALGVRTGGRLTTRMRWAHRHRRSVWVD